MMVSTEDPELIERFRISEGVFNEFHLDFHLLDGEAGDDGVDIAVKAGGDAAQKVVGEEDLSELFLLGAESDDGLLDHRSQGRDDLGVEAFDPLGRVTG